MAQKELQASFAFANKKTVQTKKILQKKCIGPIKVEFFGTLKIQREGRG